MVKKADEIFFDLMPDSAKEVFSGAKRNQKADVDEVAEARSGLAKLIAGNYTTVDGRNISIKGYIDMLTTAFVIANPSPQNTKTLYDMAGLSAPKEIDVKSGGKPIDRFLDSLSIKPDGED